MNEQNQLMIFKCSERKRELNSNLIFCLPTCITKPCFSKAFRHRNSIMQGEVRQWDMKVRAWTLMAWGDQRGRLRSLCFGRI